MLDKKESKSFQWVLIFILSIIWGSSFILIKKGLEAYSPVQVGSLRIFFAFIVLLPVALKHFKSVPLKEKKIIFIIGLLGNLVPAYLFSQAETRLSSSLAGILNGLTPIFTMLISILAFKNKLKVWQIIGVLIALIGSVGISFINSDGALGELNFYVFYIIFATFLYGICTNLTKSYLSNVKPIAIASLALLFVSPLSLGLILFSGTYEVFITNEYAISSTFYIFLLGCFGTAIALIFYNRLIHLTSAVFASSVTYLMPIVAVVWGIIVGESFSFLHLIGMFFIIFGVYKVNKP